jgi:hypothetical protein
VPGGGGTSAGAVTTNLPTFSLSSFGLTNDVATLDLGAHAVTATQSAAVQAAFDKATNGPVIINVDRFICVSNTLKLRSNTKLTGSGGFILASNAMVPILGNYNWSSNSIQDSNIVVEGLTLNGNDTYQSQKYVTNYNGFSGWVTGMEFIGENNLLFRDLKIYNAKTFGSLIFNASNITFINTKVDAGNAVLNQDGLHFTSPAYNIYIDGFEARTGDDAIGLNANDSAPTDPPLTPYYGGGSGAISNVIIKNLRLNTCASGIRMLSSSNLLDDVLVDGMSGSFGQPFIIDNYAGGALIPGGGNFGRITLRNLDFSGVYGTQPCINLNGLPSTNKFVRLTIENVTRTNYYANSGNQLLNISSSGSFGDLILRGWRCSVDGTAATNYCSQVSLTGQFLRVDLSDNQFLRRPTVPAQDAAAIELWSAIITNLTGGNNTAIGYTNLALWDNSGSQVINNFFGSFQYQGQNDYSVVTSTYSNVPGGKVAWYKLNESAGTNFSEAISGLTATSYVSSVTFTNDGRLRAVQFTNANYILGPDTGLPTNNFTCCFRFNSTNSYSNGQYTMLVEWGTEAGNQLICCQLGNAGSGTALVVSQYGGALTSVGYNDGLWHSVAFTASGNTWTLYVDGVSKGSTTMTRSTVLSGKLYLGASPIANVAAKIQMRDVRIYNSVLSTTQIANVAAGVP